MELKLLRDAAGFGGLVALGLKMGQNTGLN
jgi:hypothetical protein